MGTSLENQGLISMKLRSSLIVAFAALTPMFAGLAFNTQSHAVANESQEQTEFQKRRGGRWQNLSPEEREAKRAE